MIRWISKHFLAKTLLVTCVLFLAFCIVSTYSYYRNFTEEATETAVSNISSMMEVLNNNFELTIKDIDYVTALISNKVTTNMNGSVIDYLIMEDTDAAKLVQCRREVQDYLISMCSYKSYLQGMAIYGFNGRSVTFGITMTASEVKEQDWYDTLRNKEFEIMFSPPHYSTGTRSLPKSSQVFSIIRPVQHHGKTIGVVVADIKSSLLDNMFNINSMNGYTIYVADTVSGEVIYEPDNSMALPISKAISGRKDTDDYMFFEEGHQQYLAVYKSSDYTPWTIVGTVLKSDIISGFLLVRNKMLGLVGIYAAIFIALVLITTNLITKDLRRLTMAVASIDSENMDLRVAIGAQDEIGILYQQIQAMLKRMKGLIHNIKITEMEKRKSEIKMLQTQINPHFLYNTLNTIKILASMQGITNIQTVCNALSNILHLNLDTRKFISLSEEMDYLMNYLQIQEYRYAGKITYRFSVEEQVKEYLIPKLMLQPIVENALQHGIAPLDYMGVLQINAYEEEGHIKIAIKDNGRSFNKDLLKDNHYIGIESGHIGLFNISARLKLLFGNESELLIFNEPGLFTLVEITLPIIKAGSEDTYD
jgi:two-component system, sensor histidine kinase YesM